MSEIEYERTGKIVSGDDAGMFVRISPEDPGSGGFLILTSPSMDFKTGSDDWVSDVQHLRAYFEASRWDIEWL